MSIYETDMLIVYDILSSDMLMQLKRGQATLINSDRVIKYYSDRILSFPISLSFLARSEPNGARLRGGRKEGMRGREQEAQEKKSTMQLWKSKTKNQT